eukprot:Pompholyxophrys_sp_v1_NODE_154_length_1486_cov_8.635919.p1 type:complete len:316 gc:universal NODE_154_length_1486_cov_8.635919:1348-401(-)
MNANETVATPAAIEDNVNVSATVATSVAAKDTPVSTEDTVNNKAIATVATSPKWGRFLPSNRLNSDQVGFNFDNSSSTTYDTLGTKRVWIASSKNNGEYRATANIMCRPVNFPARQPRLTLVFKGQGLRISESERELWDTRVNVMFQRKAWMDDELCQKFAVLECPKIVADLSYSKNDELFWTFDNLSGQGRPEFHASLITLCNAMPHMLEYGCTDTIQLVDAGVGKAWKDRFQDEIESFLDENDKNYDKWVTGFTAAEKRILSTKWAAEAWKETCENFDFEGVENAVVYCKPLTEATQFSPKDLQAQLFFQMQT